MKLRAETPKLLSASQFLCSHETTTANYTTAGRQLAESEALRPRGAEVPSIAELRSAPGTMVRLPQNTGHVWLQCNGVGRRHKE
jgi:hypothetical protein